MKLRAQLEPVMEIENPESVKNCAEWLGIKFISKIAVETEIKAKTLVTVRVRGLDIRRELKIVYQTDKHLGRGAHAFIEMASD